MIKIEIDGKQIKARDGAMLIEAADEAGIYVPRFCYHKKLSIAANCRMCLVEVEKARKPLPACCTPVTDGMKIFTRSATALAAQKGVMEFLLINHPLDCPICDQGGECELQDVAMGYGRDVSRYTEQKRVVPDKNIGPLIATDMTRCIHCTRCVRFGEEVAGIKELGATGRGEHMQIGTYVEATVESELSGNVIDLCPVGALTSKPFRYSARSWELRQQETVAAHDCVGSNLYLHLRGRDVLRAVPKENEAVNETWISDRDRFSYDGLDHADRITKPRVKENGVWKEVDWEHALKVAADGLTRATSKDADRVGFLASPNATLEEHFLFQKLARALKIANIDHRLRQNDFSDQEFTPSVEWLGQSLAGIENSDALLIIGANVRKEQPIIGHRVRKAATMHHSKVSFINSLDYDLRFKVHAKVIDRASNWPQHLAGVVKVLLEKGKTSLAGGLDKLVQGVEVTAQQRAVAESLLQAKRPAILLGAQALTHPELSTLRALAYAAASLVEAKWGYLPHGANSVGAQWMGVLPHRGLGGKDVSQKGLNAQAMLQSGLDAYVLMGFEPEVDTAAGARAVQSLKKAELVIAMSAYRSDVMDEYAHVILPIAPFAENAGSFVNIEGRLQSFQAAVIPRGEARPAWKVLRVLGNMLDCSGFDYLNLDEVHSDLLHTAGMLKLDNGFSWRSPSLKTAGNAAWERVIDLPMYAIDGIVRRANSLQKTSDAVAAQAALNAKMAAKLGVSATQSINITQGDSKVRLPVVIDERVPDYAVYVPAGLAQTADLPACSGAVSVEKN